MSEPAAHPSHAFTKDTAGGIIQCQCGAVADRGKLRFDLCPRAGLLDIDDPKGWPTERLARDLSRVSTQRHQKADRKLIGAAAERLLRLEAALEAAPTVLEHMKGAGTWHAATLTRAIELLSSLRRTGTGAKSP